MNVKSIILAAIVLLFSAVASAQPQTVFEYKVDSFEITGNLPGSGFDDFNNGTVSPWAILYGTVTEAAGYLVLSNPGFPLAPPGYPNIIMERSDARAPFAYWVADGAGDFTATSAWAPVIPERPGGFYGMSLDYQVSPTQRELMAISVANLSTIVARNLMDGERGLQVDQVRWLYEYDAGVFGDGSFEEADWFLFDEADVTGDIVLRLAFDDTTNQATTSFSLDGGQTFQSPFTPMSASASGPDPGIWLLTGDPMKFIPEPAMLLMLGPGLAMLLLLPRRGRGKG